MKVAITGASGLLGSALAEDLRAGGHEVLALVRRSPQGPAEVRWDPIGGTGRAATAAALEGVHAVVHLAGAGVGDKLWTAARKREIRDSRINGTTILAEIVAGLKQRPPVLVCGSAIGFYGDTGGRAVDETAPRGEGFLAALTEEWEAAARPAAAAGIRVVHPRTGIVLSRTGGLLGKVLPLFRLGLGGKLGDGRQWLSWISLPDEIAALRRMLDDDGMSGPYNLTAPAPVTNAEYTTAIARAVHRPAVATVPGFVLRTVLRDFAAEGPLISQRVLPRRLAEAGFTFRYPALPAALHGLLDG